ncbi:ATP-binding protein [Paenibacillus piscarius]|uniref:ATP-binding protein n=1 Tax=Paenibacillus piscarius TaxID=1089681 RepID=UPI001EE94471|nr:ATP-binding protein [Paenibacillus piscarius]
MRQTIRPYLPKGSHPIERATYLIGTQEVSRMYDEIKQWIDNRSPGGLAFGRPRLGKSRAIRYLTQALPLDFGENLPIYHLLCDLGNKTMNENKYLEELLVGVGHDIPFTGKTIVKRDRLIKFLLEKAQISGTYRIIFFIDDAQSLVELQYDILMDIFNKLEAHGISFTVILVGQEELEYQRTAFLRAKKAQIVGRFMVHQYKFSGIKNIDEIETCLDGYDIDSEYPVGSGWSYTKFYFPYSYEDGFRLKKFSKDIYEIFSELRVSNGLKGKFEIPMQYFTLSVEYVLKKYGIDGQALETLSKIHWEEAIRKSGYIENEVYMEIL